MPHLNLHSALPAFLLGIASLSVGCSAGNEGGQQVTVGSGSMAGQDGSGGAGSGAVTPPNTPPPSGGSGGSVGGAIDCRAGHYVGTLHGTYRSQLDPAAAFLHLDLMIHSFENIFDENDYGLELWLEEAGGSGEDCSLGTEFCVDYVVRGGKFRGTANAYFFVNAPFDADLTGELDCTQGRFRGRLENGFYDIYDELVGLRYHFAGTIEADYDHATHSFVNATWEVEEDAYPDSPAPPPKGWGGEGQWEASFLR